MIKYYLTVIVVMTMNKCAMFQFSRYSGFSEWYFGKAGFYHTLYVPDNYYKEFECGKRERNTSSFLIVVEKRHPFYLHFRTPEIFWNLQGGLFYPASFDSCETIRRGKVPSRFVSVPLNNLKLGLRFLGGEAGLVDTLIPYKILTASNVHTDDKMKYVYLSPVITLLILVDKMFVFPVYLASDIIKVFVIPTALLYFLAKDEADTEKELGRDEDDREEGSKIYLDEEYEKFLKKKKETEND